MTTQYWKTGTSGYWSTTADWVSDVVPGSTDDVVINNSIIAASHFLRFVTER